MSDALLAAIGWAAFAAFMGMAVAIMLKQDKGSK